ncbi:MAG: CinA family nicotinamide mononucleotide deamidase-related protein [Anaerolineales bacterium]|nr:MAG: CinA family nicotinamide mononucleotide deamidase-related protein [Anaerolineales bacterium]
MQAEIVTIGTELLLGKIVDTNAAYIAQQLATIGLDLYYKTTVGDNEGRITSVLQQALARSDVVITSGGLGPTVDDVTRQAVARAAVRELVLDKKLLAQIEARFARHGFTMSENNRRQAYIPQGAIPIENPVGTAPAFTVETEQGLIISLPGVPRELKHLMETRVIPFLREKLQTGQVIIKSKTLRTCGIGESTVDSRIGDLMRSSNPTVGLAAHPGQTDVRITAKAENEAQADRLIAEMEEELRERLGDVIYGIEAQELEDVVAAMVAERGLSVAIVETNTQGLITQRLENVSQDRPILRDSYIVILPEDAVEIVSPLRSLIKEYGLVSVQVATATAEYLRETTKVDISLAVFGSMEERQGLFAESAGETHIALNTAEGTTQRAYKYGGTSELVKSWVSNAALDMVRRSLIKT